MLCFSSFWAIYFDQLEEITMAENTLAEIIGRNIAKYRESAGLTQAQLAERIGISTAFVSRVERGLKIMKVETLFATSKALSVSCDALLHQDGTSAQMENIKRILIEQPEEYLGGIEKLIRVCVEEFNPKP